MGCTASASPPDAPVAPSAAEVKQSKALQKKLNADHIVEENKVKLLLLGAGESGKSTIFKQMKIIYGTGLDSEADDAVAVIHKNILKSMRALIAGAEKLGIAIQELDAKVSISRADVEFRISPELAVQVKVLWADTGIQKAYTRRAEFQLNDSAKYFFDRVEAVTSDGYMPTKDDILRMRLKTTGIRVDRYKISGTPFEMYDVGGQRNERKKWMHCFNNVTAVIFVAAISAYDQTLYEDETQNRMHEALELFDYVCNNEAFVNTSMILFLNKRDLFEQKIKKVPMANEAKGWFTDFTEGVCTCGGGFPNDFECTCAVQRRAIRYMNNMFLAQNKNPKKTVYTHVTCATDTANVQFVFDACRQIIEKQNLANSGFGDV